MASSATATVHQPQQLQDQKFTFRIKCKLSQNLTVRDISSLMTVEEFLKDLSKLTTIPHDQMALLKGFPPKRILYSGSMTLENLGLVNQDTIIVEADKNRLRGGVDDTVVPEAEAHCLRPVAGRTSLLGGADAPERKMIHNVASNTKQGSASSGTSLKDLSNSVPRASTSSQPRRDIGSTSSNTNTQPLVASSKANTNIRGTSQSSSQGPSKASALQNPSLGSAGVMMRRVVASDNSCLFSAVTFCITGAEGVSSAELRELIATTVLQDPIKYNEGYLGRSNLEYVEWISRFDSWGGGIELAILAEFYSLEINVMDTQNMRVNRFGEDREYTNRIFLIYDGIHYDALYLECYDGSQMIRQFPASDTSIYDQVMDLGREANAAHQYTDVKNFTLRCDDCNVCFCGPNEARAHAESTRHTSFSEYK